MNWPTLVIYAIAIAIQIPFMSTALFTGPFVAGLGGADISWIIGLIVPAILYYGYNKVLPTPTHTADSQPAQHIPALQRDPA